MTRPAYNSPEYLDVIICGQPYHGWTCTYVGDGSMRFKHPDGRSWGTTSSSRTNWMEPCWERFLNMADLP